MRLFKFGSHTILLVGILVVSFTIAASFKLAGQHARQKVQWGSTATLNVDFPDMREGGGSVKSPDLGILHVRAQAHFNKPSMPETLLWFVRLWTMDGESIDEWPYEAAPVTLVPGESQHPTFRDQFPVQPGRYHVRIGLISPGGGHPVMEISFFEVVQ